jgi:5-methylcytosine-specific restriction endonuclease McrA
MNANLTNAQRKEIYRRDGFQCAVCGSSRYLQIHHYIPRGKRGTDSPHNLITLCSDCHALAHGINLVGHVDLTKADMEQNIVEYLADMYAPDWDPWGP